MSIAWGKYIDSFLFYSKQIYQKPGTRRVNLKWFSSKLIHVRLCLINFDQPTWSFGPAQLLNCLKSAEGQFHNMVHWRMCCTLFYEAGLRLVILLLTFLIPTAGTRFPGITSCTLLALDKTHHFSSCTVEFSHVKGQVRKGARLKQIAELIVPRNAYIKYCLYIETYWWR